MSGRPLLDMIQASLRVPRGIDGFWSIITEIDLIGPWTIRAVAASTNVHLRNVSAFVDTLVAGGYAVVVDSPPRGPKLPAAKTYRLLKRPADAPRLRRDGSELPEPHIETLWRTMKIAKTFTTSELAALSSTGERVVKISTARAYLRDLLRVGIIVEIRPGRSGQEAHYRLVRNLGSRAPKILNTHVVFDPNANAVVGEAIAREVSP